MTSYKHIKATPVEDDDIVVVAGVGAEIGTEASKSPSAPREPSSSSKGERPATSESEPEPLHSVSAEDPLQMIEGDKPSVRDDGYRETTLSDIEQAKMSSTQLVVIGVSLICLGAFIIWYIFFS